jgi:hypothetical protein
MINDLELTTVVDVQGILTEKFTDSDNAKIDENITMVERSLIQFLFERIDLISYQSSKLAMIEVAKRLNATDDDLKAFIKKYQDEL